MLLLLGVALVAGFVTGISPCILPVLPVVVAGGATGEDNRLRPYLIVAGLVASFSLFTLFGGSLLSVLHLPQDFLNDAGIALLILLAVGLIVPWVGEQLEKPFAYLGSKRQANSANGFVLGVGLGLVAAPCAGPVFVAVTFAANHHRVGFQITLITLAFAVGMGVPLLVLAVLARRASTGWRFMRAHAAGVRQASGVVLFVIAVAIAFNWTGPLATHVPGYTNAIQDVGGTSIQSRLDQLSGERPNKFAAAEAKASREVANGGLPDLGRAPNFVGITTWLNTPGGKPLTLAGLRGKVVLVDFWTYSCINCQRTLPHVEAWYRNYEKYGFVVVGVHTPEFPFEHVVSNVRYAVQQYGVRYPVAVDDNYDTWNAYGNNYWPAEYLIDQNGIVRRTEFEEGGYSQTEQDIRALLEAGGARHLPRPTDIPDQTPNDVNSPETYLGTERLQYYVGSTISPGKASHYQFTSSLPPDAVSFSGTWTFNHWETTAGSSAKIELSFAARDVYLVLGGTGQVQVAVDGRPTQTVQVSGVPDLYTMVAAPKAESAVLELSLSPGVEAYDFTFG